ncbi:MAG: NusA-like transcription termination signal-binding factor [Nanoarchaeota archaeon]|nr:NusA-like transcription termination signal-binding factor [Nanoarchaeota archaeon]
MARVIDQEAMGRILLFENITGAGARDSIQGETLLFIVEPGKMGLAIGKEGRTLARLENTFKKPVKLVEYAETVEPFIRNIVKPLFKFDVETQEKKVVIKGHDTKTKGLLIGREHANLKKLVELVQRHFDVEDIVVV